LRTRHPARTIVGTTRVAVDNRSPAAALEDEAMKTPLRRFVRLSGAIAMITCAISVWQVIPSSSSARIESRVWAATSAAGLDLNLAALNRYPATYQDAIYETLPAAKKLAIWREFLGESARSERLTQLKRNVLVRVGAAMRAEDFVAGSERLPRMRHLLEEAEVVLGRDFRLLKSGAWRRVTTGHDLFDMPAMTLARLGPLFLKERFLKPATVAAAADCNCWVDESGQYDCAARDGFHKYCAPHAGSTVCEPIGSYNGPCGLYDDRPCDGLCGYVAVGGGGGSGGGGGGGGGCCGYGEGNYCEPACSCCEQQA